MFPNPTEASINSARDIEVTEETPAETVASASETTLDEVAATDADEEVAA
ncbi:hypothetical protein [Mesorhizobium mediterraneum]|nr:hypothetical protein [Mesorhizobium mediterraneum]